MCRTSISCDNRNLYRFSCSVCIYCTYSTKWVSGGDKMAGYNDERDDLFELKQDLGKIFAEERNALVFRPDASGRENAKHCDWLL